MIWTYSISAIDIAPKGISKQTGAAYLLDRLWQYQPRSATYAIGDSIGDIPVLSFAHHALCPANAAPEGAGISVKLLPPRNPTTRGVVEILDHILSETGC